MKMELLKHIEKYAEDPDFQNTWIAVKQSNKHRLV
jgi:hypothetical protein